MVEGKGKPKEDPRPGTGSHEEFLELCAVATAGNLSEEEKKKLNEDPEFAGLRELPEFKLLLTLEPRVL